jgi:hypothetical protein
MALLEPFLESMAGADAPSAPEDIARLLCRCVERACSDLDLADAEVFSYGNIVTMFPTTATAWEAVAVGPDAYRLYPGVFRDDGETVVWANVWVADDYTLSQFVDALERELSAAAT